MSTGLKKNLAVIDTNVLVSSLIGQAGYSRKIFEELIFTNKIKICLSGAVYEEYRNVLRRERFRKYPGFTEKSILLLEEIKAQCFWFEPKNIINVLEDKDDNKFIELAVEAQSAYIVTGNSNDFLIKNYEGIVICSPKEFYEYQISI
jgi:putative PIN family toxin of toxin-antitoxin system